MSPRRRRRGAPRCNSCGRPVVFFRSASTGNWRPFEPTPFDRTGGEQRTAFPVENGARWWQPRELVEDLMARHAYSHDQAATEADAMPWYAPHVCLTHPTDDEDESTSPDLQEVSG